MFLSDIDSMSLPEIERALTRLRFRKQAMKATGATTVRKIATLERRRARLLQHVDAIDAAIAELRKEIAVAPEAQRPRRSRKPVAENLECVLDCVKRHGMASRALIITECGLSAAIASSYLRQLTQNGRLVRQGEKRAAVYQLP
jgi:predicted transcriptional regulator